jgi:flagellin-like hook-associated protein FlgL
MRITNSMLVNNLMSNLNGNLTRLDKFQNQMATGRKFGHISDDPTALIYSQSARNKLARLMHFQRTVDTAQDWLSQAEAGVMELQGIFQDAAITAIDAATDVKTDSDRQAIAKTMEQLRESFVDSLNTTFGDRFVFGGYNTPGDPEFDRTIHGVKPFTVDPRGADNKMTIYYNGFDLSQFDGMDAEIFIALFGHTISRDDLDAGVLTSIDPDDITDSGLNTNDIIMMHRLKNDVLTLDVGPGVGMPVTMNDVCHQKP